MQTVQRAVNRLDMVEGAADERSDGLFDQPDAAFYKAYGLLRGDRKARARPRRFMRTPTMTKDQKIIRAKVGLLELAKQLGNVSQACKIRRVRCWATAVTVSTASRF